MIEQSLVTLLLIAVIFFTSYKGFKDPFFKDRFAFDVDRIMIQKEYFRFLTSGFLHTGWWHLIFNSLALYFFGSMLEPMIGPLQLLLIFFVSLVGGSAVALLIHKNHGDYTSVGASGAVNGIVFASIAIAPSMGIGLFLLPLSIPAWAFGLAYIIFSIYGVKTQWGNTGHAAHLGGAMVGMLLTIASHPFVLQANLLPILVITVPAIGFLLLVIYKPEILIIGSARKRPSRSIDHEFNYRKAQEQADIDSILEKIHKKGMKSLTKQEKEALERYSKMNQ